LSSLAVTQAPNANGNSSVMIQVRGTDTTER